MYLSDMEEAVRNAEATINNARTACRQMVSLLSGKLKMCDNGTYAYSEYLKKLKKELQGFDSRKGTWK